MPWARDSHTFVGFLSLLALKVGVFMSNESHEACCLQCGGRDFATGIHMSLTAEIGDVGLSYKDGLLLIGTEPLRAEVCTACGTIRRLYVENVNHHWRAR